MGKDVEKEMLSAREAANGTMELWVLFDTDEEVVQAKEWMKGKQKVKTLIPITEENARKAQQSHRKEIAKKMNIKEN